MFGIIKDLFHKKTFKEAKQEYKQAKINFIAKLENKENILKANTIITEICNSCFSALRPEQEDCPIWAIFWYKKLLELGDEKSLHDAKYYLYAYLSRPAFEDFENQVSQLKEYKEWLTNKKIKEIEEDFK